MVISKNIYEWPLIPRTLLIGLVCIVLFYLGYLFDISSLNSQLAHSQQQEEDFKQQLQSLIATQLDIKNVVAQSDNTQILQDWNKKIITYSALPNLLNEILKLGANNHLHFSEFNPNNAVKDNIYFKVPIHIVAVGNYNQLASFMSQLANMPWIVVISDFSISSEIKNDVLGTKLAAEAVAENLLTAELTIEVYYIAEKSQKP